MIYWLKPWTFILNKQFFVDRINVIHTRCGAASVVELVDTPDLGSGGWRRGGSSPFARTKVIRGVFL